MKLGHTMPKKKKKTHLRKYPSSIFDFVEQNSEVTQTEKQKKAKYYMSWKYNYAVFTGSQFHSMNSKTEINTL